ncbi:hypothetical protein ACHAXR_006715 [Thalassiosira sp. AJA248-18]
MFDVSWGEIAVLTGVGLVLVGRKDLPYASRAMGQQVGRIVGLIQGARMRADRFATDHQLKQLQNEFRSGLRELDAVKAELAGSMMGGAGRGVGGGVVGGGMDNMVGGSGNNNLGALVSGVDRKKAPTAVGGSMGVVNTAAAAKGMAAGGITESSNNTAPSMATASSIMGAEYLAAAQQAESSSQSNSPPISTMDGSTAAAAVRLAPRSQSVAAVAEEEWEKRGIGFRSIAEGGGGIQQRHDYSLAEMDTGPDSAPVSGGVGGAVILSNYLRQSLIYDQYERMVREQDDALRSRVDKVRNERLNDKKGVK